MQISYAFPSLVELVAYYQSNNFPIIKDNGEVIFAKLGIPIGTMIIGQAVALRNFQPTEHGMISLRRNDFVLIMDKTLSGLGWWLGKVDDKVSDIIFSCGLLIIQLLCSYISMD